MSALNGFNLVAPWYDALKRTVFGSAIDKSQLCFLDALPRSGNILVLGGGSGTILTPLLRTCPQVHVYYVEASSRMLDRARANVIEGVERVAFIHGTEEAIPRGVMFDGVITQFILDLFTDIELMGMCATIRDKVKDGGVWLVSDFVDGGKRGQRLLLWIMYRFFVVTSGISARRLPDWEKHMQECGFERLESKSFHDGFILAAVYKSAVRNLPQQQL